MQKESSVGYSMIPLLLPSDRIIVAKSKKYKHNDIVVFRKNGRLIAHRLIYIHPEKGYLVTKGDHNSKSDGRLTYNDILGKVEAFRRNGEKMVISHIYLAQSSFYFLELRNLCKSLNKRKIPYIILKGLPLHLYIENNPPGRLYLDADFLIKKNDFPNAAAVLKRQGFEPIRPKLLGRAAKNFSQVSFVKKVKPFPVIVDVHFEPAIGFTKETSLNTLIPSIGAYTNHLFESKLTIKLEGCSFPVLNRENLLLYLLLHLFHHNFQGVHRLEFINHLIRVKKPNVKVVVDTAKKYGFENFIYPTIGILTKYYCSPFSSEITTKLSPSPTAKVLGAIILKWVSPFDEDTRNIGRAKRLFFLFLLSKQPFLKKILLLQNLQKIL